jgi:hypothetical protein
MGNRAAHIKTGVGKSSRFASFSLKIDPFMVL